MGRMAVFLSPLWPLAFSVLSSSLSFLWRVASKLRVGLPQSTIAFLRKCLEDQGNYTYVGSLLTLKPQPYKPEKKLPPITVLCCCKNCHSCYPQSSSLHLSHSTSLMGPLPTVMPSSALQATFCLCWWKGKAVPGWCLLKYSLHYYFFCFYSFESLNRCFLHSIQV